MAKYSSWPTTDQGNIVSGRLKVEVRNRFDGSMTVLSATDQKDASLAELLATTGEVFNVKSFGATGDGVTDDSVAIQSAIDAAGTTLGQETSPDHSTVFLPAGTYKIETGLELYSHTKFCGAGMGATLLYSGTAYALRTKNNARFVTLRDFQVIGGDNLTALGGILIGNLTAEAGATAYVELASISIRGFSKADAIGIHLSNPSHVALHNVSAFAFPSGVACQITADMAGTGVIAFNGCKFGEFNTTDRALLL